MMRLTCTAGNERCPLSKYESEVPQQPCLCGSSAWSHSPLTNSQPGHYTSLHSYERKGPIVLAGDWCVHACVEGAVRYNMAWWSCDFVGTLTLIKDLENSPQTHSRL